MSNNKKKEFPLNCIKLNKIKNFDLISEKIKSNSKKEFSINEKKNDEIKELLKEGAYMSVRTQMFLWQWANE